MALRVKARETLIKIGRQCDRVSLSGPCLDNLTGSIPASLHHSAVDTGTEGGLKRDRFLFATFVVFTPLYN